MERTQRDRRRRIQRLKKMILITVAALIIIPAMVSIILGIRVYQLSKACNILRDTQREVFLENHSLQEKYEEAQLRIEELEASPRVVYQTVSTDAEDEEKAGEGREEYTPEEIRKVYLTFDDGPSIYTGRILDILEQYHVKATFFVVGKHEEQLLPLYNRIVEEGHTLGMHSYSHKYNEIYRSVDAYADDLTRLRGFLMEQTGVDCRYVRFPGGSSNTVSSVNMNELISYLNGQGITYFDWNVSSGDAVSGSISPERIISNCTDNLSGYQTAVILLHDAGEKKTTVEALPKLIETIQSMENTVLLPISEETTLVQHIQNEREG